MVLANFITAERLTRTRDGDDPTTDLPLYMSMAADKGGGQTQKNKGGGSDDGDGEKGDGGQKLKEKGEDLKEDMDNLLDEIDSVLEENAEEFVKNYVQRGGE